MTKIISTAFLLVFSHLSILGQADVWFLGNNISIDFSSGTAVVGTGIVIGADLTEGSTSITDANGNLLFAVVGDKVYDGGKNSVKNLGAGTWDVAQGSMIIPVPGTTNQYYLTVMKNGSGASTKPMAEYYTITANGTGAGNLTIAGPSNLAANLTQSQTGVPKVNPDGSLSADFWYISHELCNNTFKVFTANSTGINFSHNSNAGPNLDCISTWPPKYDDIGTLKFNGCYTQATYVMGDKVMLYDFDAKTGQFTHVATQTTGLSSAYSMEFSPDGKYAYVLTGQDNNNPGHLYRMTVGPTGFGPPVDLGTTGGMRGGHLQLGPDGNIYFAAPQSYGNLGTGYIGRITSPNTGGVVDKTWYKAAAENNNTTAIEGQAVNMDMPNFLKSLVVASPKLLVDGVELSQTSVCKGDQVNLTVQVSGATVSNVDWVATGANTGSQSGSTTFSMTMANSGTTNVKATITDECGRKRDQDFIIEVEDYQNANGTLAACPSRVVTGTGSTSGEYAWYTADPNSGGTFLGYGATYDADGLTNIWVQPVGQLTTTNVTDTRSAENYGNASGSTTVTLSAGTGAITSFDIGTYTWGSYSGNLTVELRNGSNAVVGTPVTKAMTGTGQKSNIFSPTDWNINANDGPYKINVTSTAGASFGQLTTSNFSSGNVSLSGGRASSVKITTYEESSTLRCFNGKLVPIPDCCTQLAPTVSGADTVCVGGVVTLTATKNAATTGAVTYQWYSTAGLIPGATSATYAVPAAAAMASTEFWATVTSSASCSGESPISNKIRVMINPLPTKPTITISPNQTSFCEGVAHSLTAASMISSGTLSYQWSKAGSSATATQTGTTSPSGTYTYKVVVGSLGCKDSVEQVITVNPLDSAGLTVDTISSCSNQGNIDLSTYKTAGSSAGSFSGTSVTGTNFSTAIAAGVYKVKYTTSGSCPESDSLYVKIVDKAEAQIVTPDTTVCYGSAAFKIRLTGTSATDGTWSGTGVSAGTFTPGTLSAGTYKIKYSKSGLSASCSDSDSVTITIAPLDVAKVGQMPSMCSTDPTVQLALAAGSTTGGIWKDNLGTNTYVNATGVFNPSGLTDGFYKVYYVTTGSCPGIDSGLVEVTSNITYNLTHTKTTYCLNDGADTLKVDKAGGEIWTFSGTGVVDASARAFNTSLMSVGVDTIYYGKAGACGDTIKMAITINPMEVAEIDAVGILCNDSAAFNLTYSANTTTGGTWSGTGITNAANGTFDPRTAGAGSHQIIYKTPGTCTVSDTITIVVKPRLDATITADTTAFCGAAQGALIKGAQGGGTWSGWSGSWSLENDSVIRFNPSVRDGVGMVYYTIVDDCGDVDSVEITVSPMEIAQIDSNAAVCIDAGTVQFAIATGGTLGGTWSGAGIDAVTGVFNPQTAGAGKHEIKYQTPGGCYVRDSVHITVLPRANASLDKNTVAVCEGAAVQTVTGTDAGGIWRGQTGAHTSTAGKVLSFDPVVSKGGTFTIYYNIDESASTCGDSDTVVFTITAKDSAEIVGPNLFCQADNAAALTITAGSTLGGTWSGLGVNAATGVFDPSTAGLGVGSANKNTVTYTTTGACPESDDIAIEIVGQVVVDIDANNSDLVFCGDATGKFVRLTTGSTGNGRVWSSTPAGYVNATTGELDVAKMAANTGTTKYMIKCAINVSANCQDEDEIEVEVIPVLDPSISGTPGGALCLQTQMPFTGLSAVDAGGVWSINNGSIDAGTGAVTVTNGGTYTVTYTLDGGSGCVWTDNVQITVQDTINAAINAAGPFCENLGGQQLSTLVSGGAWTGAGVSSTGVFDPSSVGSGTHTITYTQTNACTNARSIDILVEGIPNISVGVDVNMGCEPLRVTFIDSSSSDATSTTWLFEDGTGSTSLDSTSKTLMGGCYGVTITQNFSNGCKSSQSFSNLVCVDAKPVADFGWNPERPSVLNSDVTFENLSTGANAYSWNFGRIATPTSSTVEDPYVHFESENGDTINVCLTAYNGACSVDTCKEVVILNNVSIYVPNSFTPNGDGLNDFFLPNGKFHNNSEGLQDYEFVIFNRWGEQIFRTTTPYAGWDGTYRNHIVQQDVYVWKISVFDPVNQKIVTQAGTVTLIR